MRFCKPAIFLAIVHCAAVAMAQSSTPWRADTQRVTLKNDAIEASFQSGLLYELKDAATGKVLGTIKLDGKPEFAASDGKGGLAPWQMRRAHSRDAAARF